MMFGTRNTAQPLARMRRYSRCVATPVVRTMENGFVLRWIAIGVTTWIVTWSCIAAAVLYVQELPPPYVLDREDD
jgi:hypothetical protein